MVTPQPDTDNTYVSDKGCIKVAKVSSSSQTGCILVPGNLEQGMFFHCVRVFDNHKLIFESIFVILQFILLALSQSSIN